MERKLLQLKVSNWGLINTESLQLAVNLEERGLIDFQKTLKIFILKGMGGNPHHTSFGRDVLLAGGFLNEVHRICKDPTSPTSSEIKEILHRIPELKERYHYKQDKSGHWTMKLRCSKRKMQATDWEKFNWHFVFDGKGHFEYFFVKGSDFHPFIHLFPYLNGHFEKAEILKLFKKHASLISEFFEFAESNNLIGSSELKSQTPQSGTFFKFVSHSCLQFCEDDRSILIDPAFLVPPSFQNQRGAFDQFTNDLPAISDTTAIVVTHHHWDHLNLQTLIRFSRDIPLFIPENSKESFFNPSLQNFLKSLGFKKIKKIRPWQKVKLKGIQLTSVPFRGEWFGPGSTFDAFCYLVNMKGRNFLGSFDADRDERGTMVPVLKKLKTKGSKIDFLFFGSSAKHHKNPAFCGDPYIYSNKFKQQYKNRMRYHPDGETVHSWCKILKPRIVIPYAEFIFHNENVQEPAHLSQIDDYEGRFNNYWRTGLTTTQDPELQRWKRSLQILKDQLQKLKIKMLMLGPGESINI